MLYEQAAALADNTCILGRLVSYYQLHYRIQQEKGLVKHGLCPGLCAVTFQRIHTSLVFLLLGIVQCITTNCILLRSVCPLLQQQLYTGGMASIGCLDQRWFTCTMHAASVSRSARHTGK